MKKYRLVSRIPNFVKWVQIDEENEIKIQFRKGEAIVELPPEVAKELKKDTRIVAVEEVRK